MLIIQKLSQMIKEEIGDAKLASCCCEIKTQMLQNRYEDERAANVALRNDISNFQQSQYILGQTGRWVAWTGSGSQTAPTT